MSKFVDLTKRQFGRLTVVEYADKNKHGHTSWLCECSCGKDTVVSGNSLKTGNTKSCGCLRTEKSTERSTKHGHKRRKKVSKIYMIWGNMIQRCTNTKNQKYQFYGARGIKVCERWKEFTNFLDDMGEAPKGYQIDRIDNNGNYCKSNCRWVTPKQNSRNRRTNRLLSFGGKTQCIVEWCEEYGISKLTFLSRLDRHGWSVEKALTTPIKGKKKNE